MSYPNHDTLEAELTNHQIELTEALNDMSLLQWKALKGLIYSVLICLTGVAMALTQGTWMQLAVVAGAVLIIFIGELKEVEIANLATFTFQTHTQNEDDE